MQKYELQAKGARNLTAPTNLEVPFWPVRRPLADDLAKYQSTRYWLEGMKPATLKAYSTHLRLLCRFYQTDPDVLIQFAAPELKVLLDAYLSYLLKIAVKTVGKPKPGQVSVNSIPYYFVGLKSFFITEHEKEINWKRLEKRFPEKVANNLRSYYYEEIQKMYKVADQFDKPLILLEYCTSVRVAAIGPMRFEHITPIPELEGFYFLKVYADSANDHYYVILTAEFMRDLEELKQLRLRWGEKITPQSFLICSKFNPRSKLRQKAPLTDKAIRNRMTELMKKAGIDSSRIQPNHSMRKAGNTAMKNAHVDRDFKEMLMGHSTGLDEVYYDVENPQSRKEIVVEYMKAVDSLTINEEHKLKKKIEGLELVVKEAPKLEVLQHSIVQKELEISAMRKHIEDKEKEDKAWKAQVMQMLKKANKQRKTEPTPSP